MRGRDPGGIPRRISQTELDRFPILPQQTQAARTAAAKEQAELAVE